jgi:hypothetical protein
MIIPDWLKTSLRSSPLFPASWTDKTTRWPAEASSRLELVFFQTPRAGTGPVRQFLQAWYQHRLRNEIYVFPGQQQAEVEQIRWQVDWMSRIVPHSGQAFFVNFLMSPVHIGSTLRPVRFATLIRDPIRRIASEFLAFRAEVDRFGDADEETLRRTNDIVFFSESLRRDNALVRMFASLELTQPIDAAAEERARNALLQLDVVGTRERPELFAHRLLSLDVFDVVERAELREQLRKTMSAPHRGSGDAYAEQLDARTRARLESRNAADLEIYHSIHGAA